MEQVVEGGVRGTTGTRGAGFTCRGSEASGGGEGRGKLEAERDQPAVGAGAWG